MRLLFAITVCCFLAVLWVALALVRRICLAQLLQFRPVRCSPAAYDKQEFLEAGEFRMPRPLRLAPEVLQQEPRRPLCEVSFTHTHRPIVGAGAACVPELISPVEPFPPAQAAVTTKAVVAQNTKKPIEVSGGRPASRSAELVPIRPAAAYTSLFGLTVQVAHTDSNLRTESPVILAPCNGVGALDAARRSALFAFTLRRRSPVPVRASGLRRRVDLSRYNDDIGDLTAPYTSLLRGSGTQGIVPRYHDAV